MRGASSSGGEKSLRRGRGGRRWGACRVLDRPSSHRWARADSVCVVSWIGWVRTDGSGPAGIRTDGSGPVGCVWRQGAGKVHEGGERVQNYWVELGACMPGKVEFWGASGWGMGEAGKRDVNVWGKH
eukprot:365096-Chlamydomonas_euryale.AAC.5